jgi:hypothetical protein
MIIDFNGKKIPSILKIIPSVLILVSFSIAFKGEFTPLSNSL